MASHRLLLGLLDIRADTARKFLHSCEPAQLGKEPVKRTLRPRLDHAPIPAPWLTLVKKSMPTKKKPKTDLLDSPKKKFRVKWEDAARFFRQGWSLEGIVKEGKGKKEEFYAVITKS